jgi:hypothetical protein
LELQLDWGTNSSRYKKLGTYSLNQKKYDLDFNLDVKDIVIYKEYVGGGYGFMSNAKLEAVKLLAENEGLLIDPVYTATAMACLIDLVRKNSSRNLTTYYSYIPEAQLPYFRIKTQFVPTSKGNHYHGPNQTGVTLNKPLSLKQF